MIAVVDLPQYRNRWYELPLFFLSISLTCHHSNKSVFSKSRILPLLQQDNVLGETSINNTQLNPVFFHQHYNYMYF